MLALGLGSLILGYLTWSLITMEMNYRRAATMGIPLVRLPVDPLNIPWVILEPLLWRFLDRLPVDWGTFGRYSRRGWHFKDKARSHTQYGPAWALVTPRDIYVYVSDSDAIHDIFLRRGDFLRPSKMYKLLEVYGPCISTASWADWPRHRKVLASPFNENIMKLVWNESLYQTREMLKIWSDMVKPETSSVAKNMRTLSLNVLAATGFGKSYKFRDPCQQESNEEQSYRDALQIVLDNAIFLMLVPVRFLLFPLLPRSWTRIGKAAAAFKQFMIRMLDEETSQMKQGKSENRSLMASFVRALDTYEKEKVETTGHTTQSPPRGLSVDEIFGNIFVINFAGHDTTANTLAFSMLLLAANPQIQDWVGDELDEVIDSDDSETWDYNLLFPKLKRCRAVLFETLRLYPPILALPKWSNDHPQTLQLDKKTIVIPPHTGIMPSLLTAQTHPKYWPDPLLWQPSRWISPLTPSTAKVTGTNAITKVENEVFITAKQSTFFPWSDGPQNCPGEKFAQVEFVAVIACILQKHRISIIREPGESVAAAKSRALATTEDCDMELLLRMRNADRVRLECKPISWKERNQRKLS